MSDYSQNNRLLSVSTPLGADTLLLQRLTGFEKISQPFVFQLSMASARRDITAEELVGKRISFSIGRADAKKTAVQRIRSPADDW